MGISEKKIRKIVLPALKDCVLDLVSELEKAHLTSFTDEQTTNTETSKTSKKPDFNFETAMNFRNNFHAFKSIIKRILASSSKLSEGPNTNSLDILGILSVFKKHNIYDPYWIENTEVAEAINIDPKISQDDENAVYIQRTLEAAKFNVVAEINSLLLGFTNYKISDFFRLNRDRKKDFYVDLLGEHPIYPGSYVLFEVKCHREKSYYPEREHIFQLYENLKKADEFANNTTSQITLISYSQLTLDQFESVTFKFHQFAKQLEIPSSYLQRINFIPAIIMEPITVEAGITNFYKKLALLDLNYDFIGKESTKNNHEVFPYYFNANNIEITITITPQNTEFWRFGFVLSNEKDFIIDKSSTDRHANLDTTDIHICAGNMPTDGNWQDSNHLTLASYNAEFIDGEQSSYLDYKQEPVIMKVQFYKGKVSVLIIIAGKSLGTKNFVCNKTYVHFMAWCDFKEYRLNTRFNVKPMNLTDTRSIIKI
ncbi:MAG: hypothetical protein Q8M29_01510 [Bacteroidota bacterium]|nr:hypothetical protein [Bacteroidota bacterium]